MILLYYMGFGVRPEYVLIDNFAILDKLLHISKP